MSTWLGKIQFGLVSLDVSLERAVVDRSLTFNQFDKTTKQRISRKSLNENGDEVSSDNIARGFSVDDKVVLFDDDEIKELKGSLEHSIEIIDFAPDAQMPTQYLGTRYFILPRGSGKNKNRTYRLFLSAMQANHCFAVVRYVLRSKQYTGIVYVDSTRGKGFEFLTLCQLPYADEIIDPKSIREFAEYFEEEDAVIQPKELKAARELIKTMTVTTFHPDVYRDEFKDKVLARVERKLAAKDRKSKSNVIPITRNRKKVG